MEVGQTNLETDKLNLPPPTTPNQIHGLMIIKAKIGSFELHRRKTQ